MRRELLRWRQVAACVVLDRGEQAILSGGHNADFTAVIGQTAVNGSLTVTCGALIVENLVII